MPAANGRHLQVVGLTAAMHKPRALEFAWQVTEALTARGLRVVMEAAVAAKLPGVAAEAGDLAACVATDMILVLGGDGTLLRVAHWAAPAETPLLGVDLGSFGFLAAEDPDYVLAHLADLVSGAYEVEQRMLLAANRAGDEAPPAGLLAFNDVVVRRAQMLHPVWLRTTLDGAHIATYPADGLIIATATGSTAYNLSAGGPLLDSRMEAVVLTPICPHTLYSRPLVVPAGVTIGLTVEGRGWDEDEVCVTVDGQDCLTLAPGHRLEVTRAEVRAQLVRLRPLQFYERLREKLRWGMER